MINAKLFWLGPRGLETPFWNAEKVRSETRLSQKHVSVEMINAVILKHVYISDRLRKGAHLTRSLLHGSNCAMQLRSDKAFLSTRTRDRVLDDKGNNSRNAFRKAFAHTFW